jgi:PAS domain S-box-containing protein
MSELWESFLEFIRWLQSVLPQSDITYLVALIGLLALLAPFSKRIGLYVYKNYMVPIGKFFSTFATLPDRLESLEKSVDRKINELRVFHESDVAEIKKELTPNGGTSIKDTVNKLATSVENISNSLNALSTQGSRMEIRQQSILHSVSIPTFETDREGHCTFANKAYLDLAGRSMEDVKGPGWINIIHPEDRKRVRDEWNLAVHEKRNFELTYKIVCHEKMIFEVTCLATPITGNGYIGKFETVVPLGYYSSAIEK